MWLFRISCTFIVLLAFVLAVIPEQDTLLGLVPESYTFDALRRKFGGSRDLNHTGTRKLYHSLLHGINEYMKRSKNESGVKERALSCNSLRWTARLYARSRDGTYVFPRVTDWVLQLRDSYVYGFRYLPHSVLDDIYRSLRGDFSFSSTTLVIQQIKGCLFPSADRAGCPSYIFLRQIRGKSDDDVLSSCVKTNSNYDSV
ncbi:uncharacterized protein TM35_000221840 [Trypanosoma theileri]|uniref:Uncharacterized protein n=1 Tax=Trypanosoma theileri TaxID=67003 RepID=A0A1X0NRP9_9TRYP|nr:uncharacterized protein TM35_000221840 [Trypanosoma theileri]ORC87385.1 hypothetical protein TM35_000221840 [Trypanosoma theileri]